jgi:hypothetical protein
MHTQHHASAAAGSRKFADDKQRHWPTGSSWMNQVERWFGLLTDKLIRRGVHTSVQALENDIKDWIATWNESPRPFTWTKIADEILSSLADYLAKLGTGQPGNRQD